MPRLLTFLVALLATTMALAAPTKTGRVEVNGVNYYYEIPDQTHYDLFVSPKLVQTVMPFLDGKSATGTWAGQVK